MLKNFFTKRYIVKGKNNKITGTKNCKAKNIIFGPKMSCLLVDGNNNEIIFNYDKLKSPQYCLPAGLNIKILGNNNKIVIDFPIKFSKTRIYMGGDNNYFHIKSQKIPVRRAKFVLSDGLGNIQIGQNCQLKGKNLTIIASNNYLTPTKIIIGDECYIAQDVLIRNSHGHTLIDSESNKPIDNQEPLDLIIENNVWIGSRCTILRGTYIAKGSIIGACSMVNKRFEKENTVLAGIPAKVIKENITWDRRHYGAFMEDYKAQVPY